MHSSSSRPDREQCRAAAAPASCPTGQSDGVYISAISRGWLAYVLRPAIVIIR